MTDWDAEYAGGRWDYLAGATEAGRYALVANLLHRFCPGGPVLDVGCGEGQLLRHLDAGRYASTGLDVSRVAVGRAEARHPSASWVVADAARYPPLAVGKFHAVVFNEVLYYVTDVRDVLAAYAGLLAGPAVVVVSTCLPAESQRHWVGRVAGVWEALAALAWAVLDDCELLNRVSGYRWRVAALTPHHPSA